MPTLLAPLFSGPYVSRHGLCDVLVCSSVVLEERRWGVRLEAPSHLSQMHTGQPPWQGCFLRPKAHSFIES